jgi:hypothetical protein
VIHFTQDQATSGLIMQAPKNVPVPKKALISTMEKAMAMIPSKIAPFDSVTTKLAARVGRRFFSRLLGAMLKSTQRQEYREIARYQRLSGRLQTDNNELDTRRRTLPNL